MRTQKESSKLGSELEGGLHNATEDIVGAVVVGNTEDGWSDGDVVSDRHRIEDFEQAAGVDVDQLMS